MISMRELEKGVKLSKSWLDENEAIATAWLNHWMLYPDLLNFLKQHNGLRYENFLKCWEILKPLRMLFL